MDKDHYGLDWDHIQAFCAVAREGSLSGAARKLGQSQPTLGRRIKAAEVALGTSLFTRVAKGLMLTDRGVELLVHAQEMEASAARLQNAALGQGDAVAGTVRITASMVVSHYVLPAIIARLRLAEPEIEIELVPTDTSENLLFREADIAVRMYRPTQMDVVTRKVAEQPLALYGATSLLDRMGEPGSLEELEAYPFVGLDRDDLIIRHMRSLGFDVSRRFFGVRCDNQAAFWELVRSGCGLGAMQTLVGDADPAVRRLAVDIRLPPLPVWLATHETLQHNRRNRVVWDFLADAFARRDGQSDFIQ
ncbi:MAG: LysR family transcriptional regulator [Pseudomonadota bacterium]